MNLIPSQEVYSRDEGSSQSDHENGIFEKVVRQICNKIDELGDRIKSSFSSHRKEDSRRLGGTCSRSASINGVCDGDGGDGPGLGSQSFDHFYQLIDAQKRQLGTVEQKFDEMQQMMLHLLNMAPTYSTPSHLYQFPENRSSQSQHMLYARWRVPNQEARQVQVPAIHDREQQEQRQQQQHQQQHQQQLQQQQQEQHFIPHGNNFFESLQSQDGRSQYSDSSSRLSDNYPQPEEKRGQRNEFVQDQEPLSSHPLARIELAIEPDFSPPDTSV